METYLNKSVKFILFLEGGTSSGKSSIAVALSEMLSEYYSVVVMHQDNYYLDISHLTQEEIVDYNFDAPDAFDMEAFHKDIESLLSGKSVVLKKYDFATHKNVKSGLLKPAEIMICEGLFIFDLPFQPNLKVFVDLDADIRIIRRILRDSQERAISPLETIEQYLKTIKPMHDKFIEPAKLKADLVVKNDSELSEISKLIFDEIRRRMI